MYGVWCVGRIRISYVCHAWCVVYTVCGVWYMVCVNYVICVCVNYVICVIVA